VVSNQLVGDVPARLVSFIVVLSLTVQKWACRIHRFSAFPVSILYNVPD